MKSLFKLSLSIMNIADHRCFYRKIYFPVFFVLFSMQGLAQELSYLTKENETIEFNISSALIYVEGVKTDTTKKYNVKMNGRSFSILNVEQNKEPISQQIKALKQDFNRVEQLLIYKDGTKQAYFGELIINLKNAELLESVFEGYKYAQRADKFVSNQYIITLEIDTYSAFGLINKIQKLKDVNFIEPNFLRLLKPSTADPYFSSQWSIKNTGYPGGIAGADMSVELAWGFSTGNNIRVAVLDEGVQLNHPDLIGNLLPGYDATGGGSAGAPNIANNDGHGTACAGIIAATANNGIGIAGVAYNAKIIPVRIAYSNGLTGDDRVWITTNSQIGDGINWAHSISNGRADVLSNSWSGGSPSLTITNAINDATTLGRNGKGAVVLFAAGNSNNSTIPYPSYLNNVIAIGASTMCDSRKRASFDPLGVSCDGEPNWGSNYGSALNLVAPGVSVYTTTLGSNYNTFSGTSAACPNAAGVVALILAARPTLTGSEARNILECSADKVGGYSYYDLREHGLWNDEMGYGRVNALRALNALNAVAISGGPFLSCAAGSDFSVSAVPGATYTWILPNGIEIINGEGSNTVTLLEYQGHNSLTKTISVRIKEGGCLSFGSLVVNSAFPETASGIDVVTVGDPMQMCRNKNYMIEANFPGVGPSATSYEWHLPPGWTGPGGLQTFTTTSFITNIKTSSSKITGFIQVRPRNHCGLGEPFQLYVSTENCP